MLFSPFNKEDYLKRIEKTKNIMKEKDLDILIIFSDAWRHGNCRYLTGIKPYPGFFSDVPGYNQALIVLPQEGDPTLFWCDHTIHWAKRGICGILSEEPWIDVKPWSDIDSVIRDLISKNKMKNIGFEGKDIIPWPVYELLKSPFENEPIETNIVKVQRRIKDEEEIKLLEILRI